MTESIVNEKCRKCYSLNPITNAYCANCGAILQVSTKMVEAQPRAQLPPDLRFSLRWMILSFLCIMGLGVISFILVSFILTMDSDGFVAGLKVAGAGSILIITVFMAVALFSGGLIISLISGHRRILETFISSILTLLLLGFAARTISWEIFYAALFLAIPGAFSAVLGAYVGRRGGR